MSALYYPRADICSAHAHVRFGPIPTKVQCSEVRPYSSQWKGVLGNAECLGRLRLLPSLQLEGRLENLLYRSLSRVGCGGVIAYMRADLYAGVLVGVRLTRGRIDQHADRLLANRAVAHALSPNDHGGRHPGKRIIKRV